MSGNLCHQIEHHLYPDLPSNRLHEISVRVRALCDKYDLPYTTGSFLMQYGKTWRTIAKLSLPDKYLRDTADDAPETRSERMFAELEPGFADDRPGDGAPPRAQDRDRGGPPMASGSRLGCCRRLTIFERDIAGDIGFKDHLSVLRAAPPPRYVRGAINPTAQGYDIIGDIHGCAAPLEGLLADLGYRRNDWTGAHWHPQRRAVFVGDLIDRGPEQLRVLKTVKAMVDAGSARIVMGNHEFNAIAYHTEWPSGSGEFLRPHNEKNAKQHQAFLDQVTGADRTHYLEWFKTLPLWLDLGDLRVIHACWHEESMSVMQRELGSNRFNSLDQFVRASSKSDPLYVASETLLKGPEISLQTSRPTTTRTAILEIEHGSGGGTTKREASVKSLK